MSSRPLNIIPLDPSFATRELIGASPHFCSVVGSLITVARTDSTILIQGETGTGKELVAKAVHAESHRRDAPFVRVNCAAIPAGLLESELFGHEKGAFTGALSKAIGRFELAHQGTLFLDEIGDLPLELQPKLLRALQEQEFERLGSARTIRVDVRIVAATNQNLLHMVRERRFRADLYYRLNVFPIVVPALRERSQDIPLLVTHFVHKFAARMGKAVRNVPEEVMFTLMRQEWPGNIRELQNVIERAVILSPGPDLHLPPGEFDRAGPSASPGASRSLAEVERDHILCVLRQARWVIGGRDGAAARLGLPRTSLIYRMRKLRIIRPDSMAQELDPREPSGCRNDPPVLSSVRPGRLNDVDNPFRDNGPAIRGNGLRSAIPNSI